jgi:ATP-dependent DNA ligase
MKMAESVSNSRDRSPNVAFPPDSGFVAPCLPQPQREPPSGPGCLHEIKHDGFRIMARRDSRGIRRRVDHSLKVKNSAAPAVRREAEEDWDGRRR